MQRKNPTSFEIFRICNNKKTHALVITPSRLERNHVLCQNLNGNSRQQVVLEFGAQDEILALLAGLPIYNDYDMDYNHTQKDKYYVAGQCIQNDMTIYRAIFASI
ncbi:hypothetical protein MA9V2_221 [Chryseobacterium phage MA9V-2]|nr:hypothetical protein MA9V2_221 [Chryseobacterium phage MA9V-2]